MTRWILAASMALLLAACATPVKQGQKVATADNDKLICVRSMQTGYHIPQRTCYTKAEAEARKKADQAALQRLENNGQVANGPSGGAGGG